MTRARPIVRTPEHEPGCSSIYSHVPFHQELAYLAVGERTNANGSRKFRDAMLEADWDTCVQMAREQVKEGAHVLDVCVDYVGRDGAIDMDEIAGRFATQASLPLVFDSTEPPVVEAGLRHHGGKAILNSANLEEGEGEGKRMDRVFRLAREYGAAVICLTIDEEGQARTADWKLRVAKRIYDLAVDKYGIEPTDLIFDALTFPLSTGDDDLRRDAMETIEAIRRIKTELPGASTILGLSNVSFGLKPVARHVLNSVFLHECREAGLDAAIVHAARIVPLNRVDERQREVALDLIYDRRRDDYDPLTEFMALFEGVEAGAIEKEDRSGWPIEERLKHRIIDGDRDGLETDLEEQLTTRPALEIVNDVLLDGMKVVGELFATGEMQLPFVLQSAETMKAAVAYLEPHMEKADAAGKGTVVLATVKGDVHDIGKNLVDIILTNNGYLVYNLGIKIAITEMIEKALEVDADAIGMSGLLVKSTIIMRENLEELNTRGLADRVPVLLGGAALTRNYVERDLRGVYEGRVFYGKDAFEGLRTMDTLMAGKRSGELDPAFGREAGGRALPPRKSERDAAAPPVEVPARSDVAVDAPVFSPPFVGSRVAKGISLDDIAGYVNETALFRNQWQFRPEKGGGCREGRRVQDAHPPDPARAARHRQAGVVARSRGRVGILRGQQRGHRPRGVEGRHAHAGVAAVLVPAPAEAAVPVHRRLLPAVGVGRARLRGVPRRDDGLTRQRARAGAVRGRPVPGVPAAARPVGRDDRGARRAVAPPHPRGVGLRRRRRPVARRPVPPAVPRVALLVGLPRLSRPRRPGEGRRAARDRPHRRGDHRGVPPRTRAVDVGDRRPPPRSEVLRRLTLW